jgi:hypothetical protein
MKVYSCILTLSFSLTLITSSCQIKRSPGEKFFVFLNDYQQDSLSYLLTDDFQLTRTYTNFSNDKATFLRDYVSSSKAYNGKYRIINIVSKTEPWKFLVEDQSDYFKYLKIENPQWIITVVSRNDKVDQVRIDSTNSYSKFTADIRRENSKFDNWIKQKYPDTTFESVLKTDGLLIRLLKEYNSEQVKP